MKRDERKEATYKSARSEGMPCSREEGQPPGGRSARAAPEANLIRLKCSAQSPLGPSRTNKVLFERTLFVAAVRRSLLCLDSPQVKFSAERVASGRPRLRGSQRQKPRKNKSAGSEGMPCSREEGQPPGGSSARAALAQGRRRGPRSFFPSSRRAFEGAADRKQ